MSVATDVLLEQVADYADSVPALLELNPTIEGGVDLLVKIQQMRRLLSVAESEVTSFLADTVPGGEYRIEGVPGVVAVERKHAVKRTEWDHDSVFRDLAKAAPEHRMADAETGQIETEAETILRLVREAARPTWRVTALKGLGLAPDEYCRVEVGAPSIKVVTA